MVSLFFWIILLSFPTLMSFFVLGGWFIILWVALGIILAYFLTLVFFLIFQIPFLSKTPVKCKYRDYLTRSVAYFFNHYIFNVRVKTIGIENLPKSGSVVVYANHKSFIDPFVIMEAMNRGCGYTPKESLYKIWILRAWFKIMRCMKIDRNDNRKTAEALVKAIADVKSGYCMTVFPEGTSKMRDSEEMAQAKAGAFKIAQKSNAVIVPVSIIGATGTVKRIPFKRTRIKVIFHPAIKSKSYIGQTTTQIADQVLSIVNQGVHDYENN